MNRDAMHAGRRPAPSGRSPVWGLAASCFAALALYGFEGWVVGHVVFVTLTAIAMDIVAAALRYLPVVPPARDTVFMRSFFYGTSGRPPATRTELGYVLMPPFGRKYYVFEEKRWGMLD